MSAEEISGRVPSLPESEVYAYTDGASTGSRGPGGYGVVISWKGKSEEISGGEQDTTNLRMEITAACVALERIDEGHKVTIYSDSSYLVNCMRRGWYKKWRENGWLNHRKAPVANRDLWERLLQATQRHQEVRWRKVKGHSKTQGPHKSGNDRADELAVAAKRRQRDRRQHGRHHDEMTPARDTEIEICALPIVYAYRREVKRRTEVCSGAARIRELDLRYHPSTRRAHGRR
jgi:ribonuclease HI